MGRKEQGIDWTGILRTGVCVGEIGMMACLVSLKVAGAGSGFGAWLALASAVSIGGDVWGANEQGTLGTAQLLLYAYHNRTKETGYGDDKEKTKLKSLDENKECLVCIIY
jgi:hypothetical protein